MSILFSILKIMMAGVTQMRVMRLRVLDSLLLRDVEELFAT
jgi:hypothetical protein